MQYAEHLPSLPSTKAMAAPLVALVIGAASATGFWALSDDAKVEPGGTKLIVNDLPGPGEGVRGIDDAAKAAMIAKSGADEGSRYGTSQYRFGQPAP